MPLPIFSNHPSRLDFSLNERIDRRQRLVGREKHYFLSSAGEELLSRLKKRENEDIWNLQKNCTPYVSGLLTWKRR